MFVDLTAEFDRLEFEINVRSNLKSEAVKNPAVGNRVYTNHVRLRGLRNIQFEINVRWLTPRYATNSSTRGGGFCLCSRGFQPPGFQPPGFQPPGFQPPGFQPPGFQPPGFQPPGFQPPGFQPPGFQPPGSINRKSNHPHPNPTTQNTDCKPHYPVPKAAANKHFESPPSPHQHQPATQN